MSIVNWGAFFDHVKAEGLYDSSLIVVTADHGEAFYEHGYWKHTQTLYEEMVRVPLHRQVAGGIADWQSAQSGEPGGRFPDRAGGGRSGVRDDVGEGSEAICARARYEAFGRE